MPDLPQLSPAAPVAPALGPQAPMPHPMPPGQPPAQLGPASLPGPNAGLAMKAQADVRNAVQMLEAALPHIPMGTDLHSEVLNSVKGLSKHLPTGSQNQGLDLMSLLQMARQTSQSQPMQTLMRAYPSNPGAPPALPPGGALPMAH